MSPDKTGTPKLCIVSELYYPEETSTGYYITKIAEALAADKEVVVLCGQPNYSARGQFAPRTETRNSVSIKRVRSLRLNKNRLTTRVINMLSLGVSIGFGSMIAFRRGDTVLVVTTPPLLPIVTAFAAMLRGASYMLLIHDVYPEQLIATNLTKPGSMAVRFINALNRRVFKHASKIIVVGRDMRRLLERKTAGLDVPIVYIPNWAELETVHPTSRDENPILKELDLLDPFVIGYAGNIGRPNDVGTIVEAATLLKDEDTVHFLFIGSGVKREWLAHEVGRRGLQNVTLLTPRPRAEQSIFLGACDAGIVPLVHGMKDCAMPSRTYNLMAAGKPIIALCEGDSELALVIDENNIGAWIEPGNAEALVEVIQSFLSRSDRLHDMGARARAAAVEQYAFERLIGRYRNEIS